MSTQQHVSSVAEYKRCGFLKHCNENGIKKYQLISNNHRNLGLFYWFIKLITIFLFLSYIKVFQCS